LNTIYSLVKAIQAGGLQRFAHVKPSFFSLDLFLKGGGFRMENKPSGSSPYIKVCRAGQANPREKGPSKIPEGVIVPDRTVTRWAGDRRKSEKSSVNTGVLLSGGDCFPGGKPRGTKRTANSKGVSGRRVVRSGLRIQK